ncbi:glycerophosphodiester phosphodiesterase GDPDL4 [Malania oleifera]|uniref:glycerophosphodiester phosphodiesterase GDPDL4 n=1 Tax=Malania oleifera TaxID=397392 RepID=UPI0025AE519B|nr:glycerophosphodiester phosphodiesterase GDPDL4 [Malania oleifera]
MRRLHALLFLLFLHSAALVAAKGSRNSTSKWLTLDGDAPSVIANGGFSGLLPHSSYAAFSLALMTSLPNVLLWCDVQLTKDAVGICFPNLRLENGSSVADVFKNRSQEYLVNGDLMKGWFAVDFTFNDLANVFLTQGVFSRSPDFDQSLFQIMTVRDVAGLLKRPAGLWLNIQHDRFYQQKNLSMRSFVLSVSRTVVVNYISSTEVNFLRSITARYKPSTTKLVFRFLGKDEVEPSTNQTFGSLLKNLTFVKTFASGILVPKNYIWPVDSLYLQPHTSVVVDAHNEGLEVFASDFANDVPFSYNFSYNPVSEYLYFIDNGAFSVDGVLSDFPITPAEAIGCFSHLGKNYLGQAKPLVISFNGASGDFPGCTDIAYTKAISYGADVVDCLVQMTKDGIPFCLGSVNLIDSSNAAETFSDLTTSIPKIGGQSGIYTFSLTWAQIQSLTPAISNPYASNRLYRNPKFKNAGKFLKLSEFLALARNTSAPSGVLIGIEYAVYLAEEQGLDVTGAVLNALRDAGYNNQTAKKVMVQSTDSSVLKKFKGENSYELVYKINASISDALEPAIEDIKKFANSVVISKSSVFPENQAFLTGVTKVVPKLHSNNLLVYVELFSNEFASQAWDFFSDAVVEINSFVMEMKIDGVITDFPQTAASYKRNKCLKGSVLPPYMSPVEPGSLLQIIAPQALPPAEAPFPTLMVSNVSEPPLPSVSAKAPASGPNGSAATAPVSPSGQPKIASGFLLSSLALLVTTASLF